MKALSGYVTLLFIGFVSAQGSISDSLLQQLIHGSPTRRLQVRRSRLFDSPRVNQRYNLGIFDADHVSVVHPQRATASASASASSSVGLGRTLGGLAGININDLLGGSGLLAGHIGTQPQIAVRRPATVARPRRTFILGQGLPRSHMAVQSPVAAHGLSAGLGLPAGLPAGSSTMLFDTPDPNTPDTPDLVYAPRSIMGDMNQIEALRSQHEADGVVFV